jgi:hypothetical protein
MHFFHVKRRKYLSNRKSLSYRNFGITFAWTVGPPDGYGSQTVWYSIARCTSTEKQFSKRTGRSISRDRLDAFFQDAKAPDKFVFSFTKQAASPSPPLIVLHYLEFGHEKDREFRDLLIFWGTKGQMV